MFFAFEVWRKEICKIKKRFKNLRKLKRVITKVNVPKMNRNEYINKNIRILKKHLKNVKNSKDKKKINKQINALNVEIIENNEFISVCFLVHMHTKRAIH